mmetsp:Transcript_26714/g.25577  ORF Transcript_26714/g.25577 Transcript_26714/m.25577 type:complete len:416 (-) Transcript_26714:154-1401(-)
MAITKWLKKIFQETVEINKLAMPSITINVLEASMILTDVIISGYLGKGNLAAVSIGTSYFNISWFFIEGVLTAQDTLSAQAFGMNDSFDLRCWLYVSILVTIFLCSISTVFLAFGYLVILHVFQVNQHVGSKAALHVLLLIPNLWFLSGFRVLQKYLLAQKILKPSVYCSLLGIAMKLLLNYFLIFLFGLGFAGIGISTSIARMCMFICLCRYLRKSEDYEKMKEEVSEVLRSAQIESSVIFPTFNISSTASTLSGSSKGIKRSAYNDDTDSINDDVDDATIQTGLLPANATSSSLISVNDHSGNLRYTANESVVKKESELEASSKPGDKHTSKIKNTTNGTINSKNNHIISNFNKHESAARLLLFKSTRLILLGLPGGFLLGLDTWIFDAMVIFTAQLGTVALGAQQILVTVTL